MKIIAACLIAVFLALPPAAAAQDIKRAAFAGEFYDRDPARLAAEIDGFLAEARPHSRIPNRILALIAPHAGYIHSGRTAARAYAAVVGLPYESVVLIGPSHRAGFRGCSIYPRGGFETPLGIAQVDEKLAGSIAKASGFGFVPQAFSMEHSVEVQIPFVQRALPGAKIVPILMGTQDAKSIRAIAAGLFAACAGKSVLVVASTDMSHFLSKEEAAAVDARTISLIRGMETDSLIREVEAGGNIMCGGGPVVAAILYAKKSGKAGVEILARTDSSEHGGPDSVVGYMAAAITLEEDPQPGDFTLTEAERAELLALARTAISEYVTTRTVAEYPTESPALLSKRGAFVTLRKNGELRGCIGFIEAAAPLCRTVVQAAVFAAVEDTRFPPVQARELEALEIEISVLSPLREITDPGTVEVGKHGLVIERGENRGLLLPQVPVENGWGRRTFLEQACVKAGLPPGSWRKGTRIFVFEAIVFHE